MQVKTSSQFSQVTEKKREITIINLLGYGCKIYVIKMSGELFTKLEATAINLSGPIEQAIFDIEFFSKLAIDNIKSLRDVSLYSLDGLISDPKSYLEIRIGGKRKRVIPFSELIEQHTLIPLYDLEFKADKEFPEDTLVAVEKEVGLISSFVINFPKIDLSNLKFDLMEFDTGFEKLLVLTSIYYSGQLLESTSDDALLSSTYAIKNKGK